MDTQKPSELTAQGIVVDRPCYRCDGSGTLPPPSLYLREKAALLTCTACKRPVRVGGRWLQKDANPSDGFYCLHCMQPDGRMPKENTMDNHTMTASEVMAEERTIPEVIGHIQSAHRAAAKEARIGWTLATMGSLGYELARAVVLEPPRDAPRAWLKNKAENILELAKELLE